MADFCTVKVFLFESYKKYFFQSLAYGLTGHITWCPGRNDNDAPTEHRHIQQLNWGIVNKNSEIMNNENSASPQLGKAIPGQVPR